MAAVRIGIVVVLAMMPVMLPVGMVAMAVPIMMESVVTACVSVTAMGPHGTRQPQCRDDEHAFE